jgi:uncharacterized protein (DUF2252 family)
MRGAWLGFLALCGCSEAADAARQAEIASVIARADEAQIRARPALSAGKYARMAGALYDYHRGSLAVFRADFQRDHLGLAHSRFALDHPLVLGTGDPHFENFGVLVASDATLALEPNDFDAADRLPYWWDVRRLAVGMVLAAHASNPDAPGAHDSAVAAELDIARAVVQGYADALVALAAGGPFERATDAGDSGILKDAFLRSQKDLKDREELEELTVLEGDHRRLVRGPPDPAEPSEALADLPANALAALPGALERYRSTLLAPPPAEHFQVLDAARVFGKGIASWPRVRILILVRGASHAADDDVILELREIGDSTVAGWYPPGEHYDSVGARIIATSRAAWARPDAAPLWGVTSLLGLPCQVRWESEGQKTLRVRRLVGQLGTAEAIIALGRRLGALQARVHGADASALWQVIGRDPEGFVDEHSEVAVRYAAGVRDDFSAFRAALDRLGPLLGLSPRPEDRPPPELAALLGTPPSSN